MEYVLRTDKLCKQFGEKKAVNNVSIEIKKGDIYGFIGKNGAGKTTLMRLVLGVATPTDGSIELFGGEPLYKARRRIGALLEYPCLYKSCTAYENLKRFSLLTGNNKAEIKEILELVGLDKTGRKKVGKFSLGMKQRLGIAIALLGNPEFLILDEPVNGLDPAGIKEIRDVLLRLNKEKGITILISSHLLEELSKLVTCYGIINDGRLIEQISAEQLEANCRHHLKLRVNNVQKSVALLSCLMDKSSMRVDGNDIYLYDRIGDSDRINRLLVNHGIRVSELVIESGGLEEYFLERMGH